MASPGLLRDQKMENDNHENDNHENKNDNEKTTSQSSDEFSTESDDIPSHTGRSDEVCEAQRVAERESVRVRLQRFITTDIMIMVTCALVLTTYGLLRDAEKQNFEKSYAQLSQTLSQAAIKQHRGNQDALESLAESLSTGLSAAESSELDSSVSSSNSSVWPFFEPKDFAREAHQVLKLSSIQTLTFAPLVAQEHKEQWLNYANRLVADSAGLNQASEADYEQFITQYHPYMTRYDPDTEEYVKDADSRDYYFPSLAVAPAPLELYRVLNYNLASYPQATDNFEALRTFQTETLLSPSRTALTQMLSPILQNSETTQQEQNTLVGVVQGEFSWGNLLAGVLPEGSKTIVAVIRSNNCNSTYTYEVTGQNVNAVASADLHDAYYDEYQRTVDLSPASFVNPNASNTHGRCQYQMDIYPTRSFEVTYRTVFPEVFSVALFFAFVIVAVSFFMYDVLVDRRNETLVDKFARSNAIVASLFPKNYLSKLMGDDDEDNNNNNNKNAKSKSYSGHKSLKALMSGDDAATNALVNKKDGSLNTNSKPLAEVFPNVTILFADLAGFTAWSSIREPHQVFTLLEKLYGKFDEIAMKRGIFKVETVGDCYVAASGLPEPQKDHAVRMVRFASAISRQTAAVTRELEVVLGPDTADLSLRTGIHSGTVTGGILRGHKARFQLFGDAMNTASRVESNGIPGRIQISQDTADLIMEAGNGHWLEKRQDKVAAKGKGLMQTYWVTSSLGIKGSESGSSETGSATTIKKIPFITKESIRPVQKMEDRIKRLVDWNVETLLRLIKKIAAHRNMHQEHDSHTAGEEFPDLAVGESKKFPVEEVKEIIALPEFKRADSSSHLVCSPDEIEIPDVVVGQLCSFVSDIAKMYNNNPFHNFEHASHVLMSTVKLLSRIASPLDDMNDDRSTDGNGMESEASAVHDSTYGITSDPLTQFACAFTALIHDVDHPGVPNAQLVQEEAPLANEYQNRSCAEQHSLNISWDLFMGNAFDDLRSMICPTPKELQRFRQLVVNCVMATDIADKDLKNLRNARWDKAFKNGVHESHEDGNPRDEVNRKATIVIEHLIQASDVAHVMQHWHVYRKWNERLFREVYKAYKEGRNPTDPSKVWYQGEIGFFDFYIIPLANKLKDCGVFGVSSDEYLYYASNNRAEWVSRGEELVANVVKSLEEEYKDSSSRINDETSS